MVTFSPIPRGFYNPCMKDPSVRLGICTSETNLFDYVRHAHSSGIAIPASANALLESTIELRDLQCVILDILRGVPRDESSETSKHGVEESLCIVGDALAFYLKHMHESDSYVLATRCPNIFKSVSSRIELVNSLQHLSDCIDSMCNVNCCSVKRSLVR